MHRGPLRALFGIRSYRLFFTARTTSALSDAMLPIALPTAALTAGYGVGGLGLLFSAQVGMFVIFVMVGGVLADRIGPRPLMIGSDVVRFVLQGSMVVSLLATDHPPFWFFLVASLVHGVATGLFQPGLGSVIPMIAPGRVQEASGFVMSAQSLLRVVGAGVAGLLVAAGGPQLVFGFDCGSYAVSALCLLAMRIPAHPRPEEPQHWLEDVKEGWREFKSRTWFWPVIVVFAGMSLLAFGPFWVVSLSMLTREHGSAVLGLVLAVEMAGGVLGGLTVARFHPRHPLRAAFLLTFPMVLPPLALGLGLPLVLIGAAFFIEGYTRSMELVLWTTTGQTQIPPAVLNRLYAYDVAGCTSLLAVGQALAGPGVALLGERGVLLASAVPTVVGCAVLLAVPAVRNLRAVSQGPDSGGRRADDSGRLAPRGSTA